MIIVKALDKSIGSIRGQPFAAEYMIAHENDLDCTLLWQCRFVEKESFMIKFLGKIQFSVEMTMWLIIYVALLKYSSDATEVMMWNCGCKFSELIETVISPANWVHWWMIPIVSCLLIFADWKADCSKWIQWLFRFMIFGLIWVTVYVSWLVPLSMSLGLRR